MADMAFVGLAGPEETRLLTGTVAMQFAIGKVV
jgi:hypothetical protein